MLKKKHTDLDLVTNTEDAKVTIDRKTFLILFDDFHHAPRITMEEKKKRICDQINTAQNESQLIQILNFITIKTKFAMKVREAMEQNSDFFEQDWE